MYSLDHLYSKRHLDIPCHVVFSDSYGVRNQRPTRQWGQLGLTSTCSRHLETQPHNPDSQQSVTAQHHNWQLSTASYAPLQEFFCVCFESCPCWEPRENNVKGCITHVLKEYTCPAAVLKREHTHISHITVHDGTLTVNQLQQLQTHILVKYTTRPYIQQANSTSCHHGRTAIFYYEVSKTPLYLWQQISTYPPFIRVIVLK